MTDSNKIIVPGDITGTDKRRFRIIPLTKDNLDRAGIGEIAVDRDTGDFYVINNDGEAISRTTSLEQKILEVMSNDINSMTYLTNRNRRVYRLFFNDNYVRLDANLILDDSCFYYRVREVGDNVIYNTTTLAPVGINRNEFVVSDLIAVSNAAPIIRPLVDNEIYFVEFYNKNKEMISMLPFSAKAAIYFDRSDDDEKIVSGIKITTNKDIMYINENISSLIVKVFAVYDDGSEREITDHSTVDVDLSNLDTSVIGDYTINATWIYDLDNGLATTASYTISVSMETVYSISDLIVVPKKIFSLNDGSKEIRLSVIAYFVDGTIEDVTERCIVSQFDKFLFNEPQTIAVTFNAGLDTVYNKTYEIEVKDSGESSKFKMLFNEDFLSLDDLSRGDIPYLPDAEFFKVRNPEDFDIYYTLELCNLHYRAAYADYEFNKLSECKNVIVEFYNEDGELLDSDVYTSEYSDEV